MANVFFNGQITEASTLGWKPGNWPEFAMISGRTYERYDPAVRGDELLYFDYRALNSDEIVRVLND